MIIIQLIGMFITALYMPLIIKCIIHENGVANEIKLIINAIGIVMMLSGLFIK